MATHLRISAVLAVLMTIALPAFGDGTKLTKDDLNDATKLVYASYGKDKYDAVLKRVVARLGPVQRQKPNMSSWFAKDGDKCIQFWVTSADKGFAATGMSSDTEDAKTGCQ